MRASTLLALLGLAAVANALVNVPITLCGKDPQIVIEKAQTTSWPPKSGETEEVVVLANVTRELTGGSYTGSATFDGIPIINQQGTLVQLAQQFNVTLPWPAGPVAFNNTLTVPNIPIHGTVTVSLSVTDEKGANIICASVTLDV